MERCFANIRPHIESRARVTLQIQRRKRGFSGEAVESPRANPEARNCAESKRSYGVVRPSNPYLLAILIHSFFLLLLLFPPQDSREGGEGRNPRISNSIFGTTVHVEWSPDPTERRDEGPSCSSEIGKRLGLRKREKKKKKEEG